MGSIYKDGEPAMALNEEGSKKVVKGDRPLARVCLMMSILEKCYADKGSVREYEKTLALEMYRTAKRLNQKLTKGVLKAITMVYQDMLRVRALPGVGRVLHCMHRIGGFRFNRSISATNLRQYKPTNVIFKGIGDSHSLLLRFAQRALYFHDVIKKYQGKTKESLKGLEVAPLNAGIHPAGNKANQFKPEVTQKP